ncbi:Adenylate cyclase, partial [Frankliniella fusca]
IVQVAVQNQKVRVKKPESDFESCESDTDFEPDEALKEEVSVLLKVSPSDYEIRTLMTNLDRGQISTSNAFRTVSCVAMLSNIDITQMKLDGTSIYRKRTKVREETAASIREAFRPEVPLTVHMDGKKMPPLKGKGDIVERLPVLVTGLGKDIANEVVSQLQKYKISDRVQCVSCDTTSSNTGCNTGAIQYLQNVLGRPLIYLACRHHALEIIPKHLFENLVEKSSSPTIGKLCKDFELQWPTIDQKNFSIVSSDPDCQDALSADIVQKISEFVREALQVHTQIYSFDRIFLKNNAHALSAHTETANSRGLRVFSGIGFNFHRSFGKSFVYIIRRNRNVSFFPLAGQFSVDESVMAKIRDICVFVVTTYVKPWFTATIPALGPRTDLQLLKDIQNYEHSKEISKIAFKAYANHLWYLSPYSVALAFFDKDVTVSTKERMVKNLSKPAPPREKKVPLKATLKKVEKDTDLSDFINVNTSKFFTMLEIPTGFLERPPSEWPGHPDYIVGLKIVHALHVVNDISERAVRLTSDYNNAKLTLTETSFQDLLLARSRLQNILFLK